MLKLKQVLDAKEETILFLDDKMRYYEELLRDNCNATATITTTSVPRTTPDPSASPFESYYAR